MSYQIDLSGRVARVNGVAAALVSRSVGRPQDLRAHIAPGVGFAL